MLFEFDYGEFSSDRQYDSIEKAIAEAHIDGQVEAIRVFPENDKDECIVVWSAEAEANNYNFSTYDRDDIINDLFMLMDELAAVDAITIVEKKVVDKLKDHWKNLTAVSN